MLTAGILQSAANYLKTELKESDMKSTLYNTVLWSQISIRFALRSAIFKTLHILGFSH